LFLGFSLDLQLRSVVELLMGTLTDARYKKWDLLLKVVGALALIIGGLWALYQYKTEETLNRKLRQQQVEQQAFMGDYNKRFDATTELFKDMAIAVLATDDKVRQDAKDKLLLLYNGTFQLLASDDKALRNSMAAVADCLSHSCAPEVLKATVQQEQPKATAALKDEIKNQISRTSIIMGVRR
jgi:hypothetical protein